MSTFHVPGRDEQPLHPMHMIPYGPGLDKEPCPAFVRARYTIGPDCMLLALSGLYELSYYRYDDHCHRLGRVGHSCGLTIV